MAADGVHPQGAACLGCGRWLGHAQTGPLCTACLFLSGMRVTSRERIGPYDCLHRLAEGGTGIIYIVRHRDQGLLALKIAKPEVCGNPEALLAFRNGLRIQQRLRDQANVLGMSDIGTHDDGRPYGVMPLLDGTLDDPDVRARYENPDAAIELMLKLARAVHAAHKRGVLHCDIKPGNVLFNADGEPFVSDFGLARVARCSEIARGAAFEGGTPGWMSPEQAAQREVTTASDVYGLGALLHWLLGGRPRPWELDQICARAMHSRPEQRYDSADDLVADLECARDDLPIEVERRMPLRCARKWIRRHTLAALAVIELAMLLVYLPLMPLSVFHEITDTVRTQISYAASAQAGAVMNELRAFSQRLETIALDPELPKLLSQTDPQAPAPALEKWITAGDGLSVFSTEGLLRARAPKAPFIHSTYDFSFRDYFRGQRRFGLAGRRAVYVARAFHAKGDERPMLGLSTPLYEGDRYVGALLLSLRVRATFGAVQMNCGAQGTCMTALLGPRDRDPGDVDMPNSIFVLATPGLGYGQEILEDTSFAKNLCKRFSCQPAESNQFDPPVHPQPLVLDNYEHPISHIHSIAAIAPVGRTGLFVVVATPLDALDAVVRRMADRAKAFVWVPVLSGLVLLGAVMAAPALTTRRGGTRSMRPRRR